MAAAQLGYKCHVYAPDEAPPAAEVAAALHPRRLGRRGGAAPLRRRGRRRHLRVREYRRRRRSPRSPARRRCTRRARRWRSPRTGSTEKKFIARAWADARRRSRGRRPGGARRRRWPAIGAPAILKTRRFGYDGKGQARILTAGRGGRRPGRRSAARPRCSKASSLRGRILDPAVPVAGRRDRHLGRAAQRPRGRHPRPLDSAGRRRARAGDRRGRGAGAQGRPRRSIMSACWRSNFSRSATGPMFNEMAPRVHNSGHWTIEGALTSQFENHIRAICGLPLGATDSDGAAGRDAQSDRRARRTAGARSSPTAAAHLHLYGKGEARPGRKMGHVTRVVR